MDLKTREAYHSLVGYLSILEAGQWLSGAYLHRLKVYLDKLEKALEE